MEKINSKKEIDNRLLIEAVDLFSNILIDILENNLQNYKVDTIKKYEKK